MTMQEFRGRVQIAAGADVAAIGLATRSGDGRRGAEGTGKGRVLRTRYRCTPNFERRSRVPTGEAAVLVGGAKGRRHTRVVGRVPPKTPLANRGRKETRLHTIAAINNTSI